MSNSWRQNRRRELDSRFYLRKILRSKYVA